MSSGSSYQQRRRLDAAQDQQQDQEVQQQGPDLEGLDQGRELTADMAAQLAPQLGNLALQTLLGDQARGTEGIDQGQTQGEEQEQEQELVEGEELIEDLELEGAQFGGGGGAPAAPADDPWDVGKLFGDDDDEDDEAPTPQRPRNRKRHRRGPVEDDELDEGFEEGPDDGALNEDDLAGIDEALGEIAPREDGPRDGDARYQAVEAALLDPVALGRRSLEPEDLVGTADAWDPIGRPAEIGRFLEAQADAPRARALARMVARAGAALVPGAGGYSGGVARMATLAVCAEAAEGGASRTDRAVALALEAGVWEDAVSTARPMAQQGRLHAQLIHDALVGDDAAGRGGRHLPDPSPLGGRALSRVVPISWIPPVPPIRLQPDAHSPPVEADLADLDALMDLLITGAPPPPSGPEVPPDPASLKPTLFAARHMMNAVGRCHVELAAAAFAVTLVRPDAPVRTVLTTADRALRQLARAVLRGGRRVESLGGKPRGQISTAQTDEAHMHLEAAGEALRGLRTWAFASLAGAMDV